MRAETNVVDGTGPFPEVTNNLGVPQGFARRGDYYSNTVDPRDDRTFWFVGDFGSDTSPGVGGTWIEPVLFGETVGRQAYIHLRKSALETILGFFSSPLDIA